METNWRLSRIEEELDKLDFMKDPDEFPPPPTSNYGSLERSVSGSRPGSRNQSPFNTLERSKRIKSLTPSGTLERGRAMSASPGGTLERARSLTPSGTLERRFYSSPADPQDVMEEIYSKIVVKKGYSQKDLEQEAVKHFTGKYESLGKVRAAGGNSPLGAQAPPPPGMTSPHTTPRSPMSPPPPPAVSASSGHYQPQSGHHQFSSGQCSVNQTEFPPPPPPHSMMAGHYINSVGGVTSSGSGHSISSGQQQSSSGHPVMSGHSSSSSGASPGAPPTPTPPSSLPVLRRGSGGGLPLGVRSPTSPGVAMPRGGGVMTSAVSRPPPTPPTVPHHGGNPRSPEVARSRDAVVRPKSKPPTPPVKVPQLPVSVPSSPPPAASHHQITMKHASSSLPRQRPRHNSADLAEDDDFTDSMATASSWKPQPQRQRSNVSGASLLSDADIAQVEMFYRSHKSEVFVCGCMATMYDGVVSSVTNRVDMWNFQKPGIPVLVLDSGESRRARKLSILLSERGTGFALWRDVMNHLTNYSVPDSDRATFHTLHASSDHNKMVALSFDDAVAASDFLHTIHMLTNNPDDDVLNLSGKKKKGTKKKEKKKEKYRAPTKAEISAPCCFTHVTKLDQGDGMGLLTNPTPPPPKRSSSASHSLSSLTRPKSAGGGGGHNA